MSRFVAVIIAVLLAATWSTVAPAADAKKEAPAKAQAPAAPAKAEAKKAGEMKKQAVDLNSASVDELKALPGLTDEDVKKIVDNRPYDRKNDLLKKKIVAKATYDGIKGQIIVKKK